MGGLLVASAGLIAITYAAGDALDLRSTEVTFAAGTVIALGLLPGVMYYLSGFAKPIPLFELNCLFYVLGFGLTALSETGFHLRPDDSALAAALWLVAAGLIALWIGYATGRSGVIGGRVSPLNLPIPQELWHLERAGWIGAALQIVYSLVVSVGFPKVPILIELSSLLGILGRIILLWMFFSGNLNRVRSLMLLGGILPFEIVMGITGGLLLQFLRPMLEVIVVYVYVRRRVPYIIMAIVISIFIFLNPAKTAYRFEYWSPLVETETSRFTKLATFVDLAIKYWTDEKYSSTVGSAAVDTVSKRLDLAGLLGYVMETTPSEVPFWEGKTLLPIVYYWIPRIVWPGKPTATLGNEWAKVYGIISYFDTGTSWNLPWVVEFYMNFGWGGVVICMLIVGILIAQIENLFASADRQILSFCVGITVALVLWYAESNFVLMWANIVTKIVVAVLFCRYVAASRWPTAKSIS